jgi:hypothetical protein
MHKVKISLIHDDILNSSCPVVFVKHIETTPLSRPERCIDKKLNGRLSRECKNNKKEAHIILEDLGSLGFSKLFVINFHKQDLPFKYHSVFHYAERIIELAQKETDASIIATAVHGPGDGLDSSEAMQTMIFAFTTIIGSLKEVLNIREIQFVEKEETVFQRLKERTDFLVSQNLLFRDKSGLFIIPHPATVTEQAAIDRLDLPYLFVAMPYAKEFKNAYYFGMKAPIEQRQRRCERADQEVFVGDIVERVQKTIQAAELVIADITGNNPNVFYEVGYAEGVNKKTILISQQTDNLPFDMSTRRVIRYEPMDIDSLAKDIGKYLDVMLPPLKPN